METMTLEQMYYIGELVGVIALVTSLIYVGKQIRQNTETMQVNAAGTQAQWVSEVMERVMYSRDNSEWWIKGETKFNTLDEVDKQRLIFHEYGVINMWNHFFFLHQHNLMPDEQWNFQTWGFKNFGGRQSVREAWKIVKGGYGKPFQDFISQYLE